MDAPRCRACYKAGKCGYQSMSRVRAARRRGTRWDGTNARSLRSRARRGRSAERAGVPAPRLGSIGPLRQRWEAAMTNQAAVRAAEAMESTFPMRRGDPGRVRFPVSGRQTRRAPASAGCREYFVAVKSAGRGSQSTGPAVGSRGISKRNVLPRPNALSTVTCP